MHWFIRLLHDKGLLLRNYTQNIDMLEAKAGLPAEVSYLPPSSCLQRIQLFTFIQTLVEAHGTFSRARCTAIECGKYIKDMDAYWQTVNEDKVRYRESVIHQFMLYCKKRCPCVLSASQWQDRTLYSSGSLCLSDSSK